MPSSMLSWDHWSNPSISQKVCIGQKLPPNSSSHPERALNGLSILHLPQRRGHQPPEKLSPPIRSQEKDGFHLLKSTASL